MNATATMSRTYDHHGITTTEVVDHYGIVVVRYIDHCAHRSI